LLLKLSAGSGHLAGDSFFPGADASLRSSARGADHFGALVEHRLMFFFLLGVQLSARLPQRFVVGVQFFLRGGLRGCGFGASAFHARAALGQHSLNGLKKVGAKEKVKQKNEKDGGHSFEKQLAELVQNIHRARVGSLRLPSLVSSDEVRDTLVRSVPPDKIKLEIIASTRGPVNRALRASDALFGAIHNQKIRELGQAMGHLAP
jgi:hypothetical protein